jgi:hypothetical protein
MSNFLINNMSTVILGIIGIIITYYYATRKKYPKSLLYIETGVINLKSSVLQSIDDIRISYKGNSIKNDIFIIKGVLFNNGKADLVKEDFEKDLKARLKTGNLLNASIITTSDNVNANLSVIENCLVFNGDLLKIDEFIYFESLAETSSKNLIFSHRIPNLGEVKSINFVEIVSDFRSGIMATLLILLFSINGVYSIIDTIKTKGAYSFTDFKLSHFLGIIFLFILVLSLIKLFELYKHLRIKKKIFGTMFGENIITSITTSTKTTSIDGTYNSNN